MNTKTAINNIDDVIKRIEETMAFRRNDDYTMADELEISGKYFRSLLRSKRKYLTTDKIREISRILEVSYDWLMTGDVEQCPWTHLKSPEDLSDRVSRELARMNLNCGDICDICGIMGSDFVKFMQEPGKCPIPTARTILATLGIDLDDIDPNMKGVDHAWVKKLKTTAETDAFIGFRIKSYRMNRHLSREKLAETIQVSVEDIINWESSNCMSLRKNLDKLAEALDEHRDMILYGRIITIDKKAVQDRLANAMTFLKIDTQISEWAKEYSFSVSDVREGRFNQYDLFAIDMIAYEMNIDREWLLSGDGVCPYDNLLTASEYADYVEMLRIKHNLTRMDVANALHITTSKYTRLVGKNGNLSWHDVERICLVIGEEIPTWIRTRHYNNQELSSVFPIEIRLEDGVHELYPNQLTSDVFSLDVNTRINHNIHELMYFHNKREKWFKYQSYTAIDQARMFKNESGNRTVFDIMRLADIFKIPVEAIVTNEFWKYFVTTARVRLIISDLRNKYKMTFPQFSTATGIAVSRLEALTSSDIHVTYDEINMIAKTFGFTNGYALIQDIDFIQNANLVDSKPSEPSKDHDDESDNDKTLPDHMLLTIDMLEGDVEITERIKAILSFQNRQMMWFLEYGLTGDEYTRITRNPNKNRTVADLKRLSVIIDVPMEAFISNEDFEMHYISVDALCKRMNALCNKFNLSREQFSEITGLSLNTTAQIKNGLGKPSYDEVQKIAKSFGFASVSEFISDNDYVEHAEYTGTANFTDAEFKAGHGETEFSVNDISQKLYDMLCTKPNHQINDPLCKKILVEMESLDNDDLNEVYNYIMTIKKTKKYDKLVENLSIMRPTDDVTTHALKKAVSRILKE